MQAYMYIYKTSKESNGNTLAIRPAKQLQPSGKKGKLSWLRKIFKRIKIDQKALRQTLEITSR
jgi:hypothetical protein